MTAPTPVRPRTAAASDAWRRRGATRAAAGLVTRVEHLDDRTLMTVTERLLVECAARELDARGLIP